jgi:hypothetical protein
MSTDHDTELLKIAERVSDNASVDWDEASSAYPAVSPTIAGLQRVEAVADAFRSAKREAGGEKAARDAAELRVWGRLEVLEIIGAGSFGEVYRARDPLLDREVALKLRKQTESEGDGGARRSLEEGKRLARVRHPNVLTVHGADIDHGRVGLWTELIEGPDLRAVIGEDGPLDPAEAIAAAITICRALNAVHGADLVHGDVKASNVFRDADGRIVLGDFGSAMELDSNGLVSGSPVTLAPERLRGAPAEPASDVYSVGVLLYFMLSGRYPVEATTVEEILEQHESSGPIPLEVPRPDLPAALADLVNRAVAADPARRFTTASELELALETVLAPEKTTTRTEKTISPPANRRQILMWSAFLAASALAVVVFFGLTAGSPPGGEPLITEARLVLDTVDGPVTLEDGAAIAPGDRLYLEIEAKAPVHVYVANEDEAGAVFTLFPVPGLDLDNPIPAGRHRLPGTIGGAANDWQVTSAGGAETFLVVAAPVPVPEIEERLDAWAAASADRPVTTSPEGAPTLRGVGGLAAASTEAGEGASLGVLQEQISRLAGEGQTFWSRRIVLHSGGGG